MLAFQRKITYTGLIMYAMYLYIPGGLSFKSKSKALDPFVEKRTHVVVWNQVELFHPNKFCLKRSRANAFIIDENYVTD